MSYTVTTGYRMPTFSFETDREATRFNEEYFAKNGVRGSVSITNHKATYRYTEDCKLVKM